MKVAEHHEIAQVHAALCEEMDADIVQTTIDDDSGRAKGFTVLVSGSELADEVFNELSDLCLIIAVAGNTPIQNLSLSHGSNALFAWRSGTKLAIFARGNGVSERAAYRVNRLVERRDE